MIADPVAAPRPHFRHPQATLDDPGLGTAALAFEQHGLPRPLSGQATLRLADAAAVRAANRRVRLEDDLQVSGLAKMVVGGPALATLIEEGYRRDHEDEATERARVVQAARDEAERARMRARFGDAEYVYATGCGRPCARRAMNVYSHPRRGPCASPLTRPRRSTRRMRW